MKTKLIFGTFPLCIINRPRPVDFFNFYLIFSFFGGACQYVNNLAYITTLKPSHSSAIIIYFFQFAWSVNSILY